MKPRANPIHPLHRNRLAFATAALVAAAAFAAVPQAFASTFISVNIAPPLLPVYEQPMIPGAGYLWTPGYWAWDPEIADYYWVPGTWVRPPRLGVYWTPGYWGWGERVYVFHPGYWGPHVGYYGGINYGYGYVGIGYAGGYWRNGGFFYNTAVNRFGPGVHITNVYNRTVINNITINRFSFNGPGGVNRRATRAELVAEHERHIDAVAEQVQHREAAQHNEALRAKVNHGAPPIAATERPGDFAHAKPAMKADEADKAAMGGKAAHGGKAMNDAGTGKNLQTTAHAASHDKGAGGKGASTNSKIILQHHAHTHTQGPGGGHASTDSKIILQHHAHTHAQGPGGGQPSTDSRIILQHHVHDEAPRPHPVERMQQAPSPRQAPPPRGNQGSKTKDHNH